MKTNFKDYLKKKNAQTAIDKIAKEYENKKIILFGADLFAGDLFRNYDLSKLNIIGVTDKNFKNNIEGNYYGYQKFSPEDIIENDFDLLLITEYDDTGIKEFLRKELLQGEEVNFKIKSLITMNLIEYIKGLINKEF